MKEKIKRFKARFKNSENSKTFDPSRLLLNLSDEINLRGDKHVTLSNLRIYYI